MNNTRIQNCNTKEKTKAQCLLLLWFSRSRYWEACGVLDIYLGTHNMKGKRRKQDWAGGEAELQFNDDEFSTKTGLEWALPIRNTSHLSSHGCELPGKAVASSKSALSSCSRRCWSLNATYWWLSQQLSSKSLGDLSGISTAVLLCVLCT